MVLGLEIKTLVREHQDIAGSDMFIPNMVSPSGTGPVISLNSGNHLTCLVRKQLEVSTTAWCSKLLKFSMQGPCLHILVPTSWRLQFSELPLPFLGSHWLSSGAFMCFFGWRPPWCDPLTRSLPSARSRSSAASMVGHWCPTKLWCDEANGSQ